MITGDLSTPTPSSLMHAQGFKNLVAPRPYSSTKSTTAYAPNTIVILYNKQKEREIILTVK